MNDIKKWTEVLQERIKRKNKILFTAESPLLYPLFKSIERENRRTVALFSFSLAEDGIKRLNDYGYSDKRPAEALIKSRMWAAGEIKMPEAKKAISECHAAAKTAPDNEVSALCHAIGQACSVVHTVKHAMGYPIYELSSIVYRLKEKNYERAVEKRVEEYFNILNSVRNSGAEKNMNWAKFMLKD